MKQIAIILIILSLSASLRAADWPQWGHDNSRNMVGNEKNLPDSFDPGNAKDNSDQIDLTSTKNVKWVAKLGSQTYGNPTVGGGRVYVGTNNDSPRNPKRSGDFGVLMCFDEKSGKFLWQLLVPKLEAGKNSDWEGVGLCCSATIDGDRIYIVTNRCEVLCLTAAGKPSGDADVVWRYDMRDELGLFPHNQTSSSVLVVGDRLYVTTSNGVDWTNKHIPNPGAPALICLDKKSGQLIGQERSGICSRMFKSNWSSPAYGKVAKREMVIFGGGDGYCYGFAPVPVPVDGTLREIWRCDCNPADRRFRNGQPLKYGSEKGPCEIIATPVLKDGLVYVAIGQDPESGEGAGALTCIDASQSGDITKTGKRWVYPAINRSISTVSVENGLVFAADFSGIIHCINAADGNPLWTQDTEAKVWGSTLVSDGKLFLGNESGAFTIMAADRVKKVLGTVNFDGPVYSSAITANGALYVATDKYLYAIGKK